MIEILEHWKSFEEKKWKRILKSILGLAVGELGAELISSGFKNLVDWITNLK